MYILEEWEDKIRNFNFNWGESELDQFDEFITREEIKLIIKNEQRKTKRVWLKKKK